MASKQEELVKIITEMQSRVKEAVDKNKSAREAIKQQVTELHKKVDEFQSSANDVLLENDRELQALGDQLTQCSQLLGNPSLINTSDVEGTTTDAEVCTSENSGSSSDKDELSPKSPNPSLQLINSTEPNDSTTPPTTEHSEYLTLEASGQSSRSRVKKKLYLPKKKKKHRLSITWNQPKLVYDDDGGAMDVVEEEEVNFKTIDGYGADFKQLKYPYLLVNGPNKELIVSDRNDHQLIVFDEFLKFLYVFGGRGKERGNGTFYSPTGLAVDETDRLLYVADYNNLIQIFKVNKDSCKHISQFGVQGRGKGQFNCPCGLLFSKSKGLFVCDFHNHRVQVFSKDGKFSHEFGRHGTQHGEFREPHSIAINNTEDKLFVTDHSNNRIQIFSPGGEFLEVFENSPSLHQQLQYPRGIFYKPDGCLLVSCTHTPCILELKEDGSYVSTIEGIVQPGGIVLRHSGEIVVTSNVNQVLIVIKSRNM